MKVVLAGMILFTALAASAQDATKPRIYVTDNPEWEVRGQTTIAPTREIADIIKNFGQHCRECVVTASKDRADYVVLVNQKHSGSAIRKDNDFVLFNKDGDAVRSGATRKLGNAVKDICEAMMDNWKEARK